MQRFRKLILPGILFLICLGLHFFSRDSGWVENSYSGRFFPLFSHFLRYLSHFFGFSIGDIIYGVLAVWLFFSLIRLFYSLFKNRRGNRIQLLKKAVYVLAIVTMSVYILFNLFWGINYNRKGIAWQLGIKMEKQTLEELIEINQLLLGKTNQWKDSTFRQKLPALSEKEIFHQTTLAYRKISFQYPFLNYTNASIKSSMYGWLGNYSGFTGYYNPFTGEAQVNTTVPVFLQPFIACHEVAHQLGYARENEANFVAFLAARSSDDSRFRYSLYLELFMYANRKLYYVDSSAANKITTDLSKDVKKDIKTLIRFQQDHQSFLDPLTTIAYDFFLRHNMQPQGILSYSEVTAYITAYKKKYGEF